MAEKNLIINNKELNYKGIFVANELFRTINRALEKKGYSKKEEKTEELVTEEGRRSYIVLAPSKTKTSYVTFKIKIKILLDNVTETTEEINGIKRKFQQGDVNIKFDAWLITDYEFRWGMKPFVYFLKGVINKYIYSWPLEGGFPGELTGDTAYVYAQVRKLFNSYIPKKEEKVKEEEIKRKIEKEILSP